METQVKQQRAKVGVAGSFFNQLMSNNQSVPEVGKGATIMHYTDRTVAQVIEVSKDGKTVKMERLETTSSGGSMGDQNWIHTPTGQYYTLKWRHNAWRRPSTAIEWDMDFYENNVEGLNRNSEEYKKIVAQVFDAEGNFKEVPGMTVKKTTWSRVKILFGEMNYYYDWSF